MPLTPCRSRSQLLSFDQELDEFRDRLHEFPIEFPPSYPFEENVDRSQYLMKTRCPSWCDRILMSKSALQVIHLVSGRCLRLAGKSGPLSSWRYG